MLVLLVLYGFAFMLLPAVSSQTTLVLHFIHALVWCMIHYFGLGLLLRAQSESKFLVRHYLKNYHYAHNDGGQNAIIEAFANWKAIYNLSMCMTYGAFSTHFLCSVTALILPSLVYGRCLESISIPKRLGRREWLAASHNWPGMLHS